MGRYSNTGIKVGVGVKLILWATVKLCTDLRPSPLRDVHTCSHSKHGNIALNEMELLHDMKLLNGQCPCTKS